MKKSNVLSLLLVALTFLSLFAILPQPVSATEPEHEPYKIHAMSVTYQIGSSLNDYTYDNHE